LHGHEQRAQHAAEVDAVVALEVAVLDRLQAGDQQLGHVLGPDRSPLHLLRAVQGGDPRRIQPRRAHRLAAAEGAQAVDPAARQHHFDPALPDPAVHVDEAAAGDAPAPAFVAVGARAHAGAVVAVGRGGQLGGQGLRVHGHARREQQRTRIDPRRQLPAQLAETLGDLVVEVQGVGNQEAQPQARGDQCPGEQAAAPSGAPAPPEKPGFVFSVVVGFDARHGAGATGNDATMPRRTGKASSLAQLPSASGSRSPHLQRESRSLLAEARFLIARATGLAHRTLASLRTRAWRARWSPAMLQLRSPRIPAADLYQPATPGMEPFAVPTAARPRASIVVPVYGQLAHTLACLRAIAAHPPRAPVELIVVDDASPDDSGVVLPRIEGLRYRRRAANGGFIAASNEGAALARGEVLVFLNNDTVPQPGWLDALLDTFEQRPGTGLVGAQLLYPDGRLQEAGGLVFADGSAWNYGRFGDPRDPRFGYV